jgi:hypothetical protein
MATSIGMSGKKKNAAGFEMKKLEEAVHYICANTTEQDRLGAVKLHKVLYYADNLSHAQTGRAITGSTYVKQRLGPIVTQMKTAVELLEREARLKVTHVSQFDYKRRVFETAGETDTTVFEPGELERLNEAIRFVCGQGAMDISELSHHIVWQAADIGEVLPYNTFLVAYLGDIGEAEIALAQDVIRDAAKDGRAYG